MDTNEGLTPNQIPFNEPFTIKDLLPANNNRLTSGELARTEYSVEGYHVQILFSDAIKEEVGNENINGYFQPLGDAVPLVLTVNAERLPVNLLEKMECILEIKGKKFVGSPWYDEEATDTTDVMWNMWQPENGEDETRRILLPPGINNISSYGITVTMKKN